MEESMAAQPINCVTAPDTLPTIVFNVYLRFVHSVYNTTYVNQPTKANNVASIVVNNNMINPITVVPIDSDNTTGNEIFPVTVGRDCVRFISTSRSTSYQLLNINAPAMTNVLPTIVSKKRSELAVIVVPVK